MATHKPWRIDIELASVSLLIRFRSPIRRTDVKPEDIEQPQGGQWGRPRPEARGVDLDCVGDDISSRLLVHHHTHLKTSSFAYLLMDSTCQLRTSQLRNVST